MAVHLALFLTCLEGLKGYDDDDDSLCFGCEGLDRWEVPHRLFNTRKVC